MKPSPTMWFAQLKSCTDWLNATWIIFENHQPACCVQLKRFPKTRVALTLAAKENGCNLECHLFPHAASSWKSGNLLIWQFLQMQGDNLDAILDKKKYHHWHIDMESCGCRHRGGVGDCWLQRHRSSVKICDLLISCFLAFGSFKLTRHGNQKRAGFISICQGTGAGQGKEQ